MSANRDASSHGRGTRERNKQDKLERIQNSAWALFRRDGFAATTTKAVAESAGVATGTVFLYAPDKAALLALAFERSLVEALEQAEQERHATDRVEDRILHVFNALFGVYEQDLALAREYVRFGGAIRSPTVSERGGVTERLIDALTRELASSVNNDSSHKTVVDTLVHQCLAQLLGVVTLWLEGWLPAGEDPRAALRDALQRLLGPLGPAAPSVATRRVGASGSPALRPSRGAGIFRDRDDFVD